MERFYLRHETMDITDKDKRLIQKAEQLHFSEWDKCIYLAETADTDEAKRRILYIERLLFHKEEYYAGLL